MDTVIAEAARNNVKLVIALMNNWNYNPLQTDWKCAPPRSHNRYSLLQLKDAESPCCPAVLPRHVLFAANEAIGLSTLQAPKLLSGDTFC